MNEPARRGRKPGTKNPPRDGTEKSERGAYQQRKKRAAPVINGMTENSIVTFDITQAKADLLFQGKVKVELPYKIGTIFPAKRSHSGRDECTLHTVGGILIGFVKLEFLKPENV